MGGRPRQPGQWAGSRGRTAPDLRRPSQWWKAPPPGNALPPPPQRAMPARRGARCGAGAGSPRPHRPHPGHTGRGAPAARSRGRAAGGGTAPDTRRPSQRWQAAPPGDGPSPPPRHAAPTGHAGQGDSVGPPHPHTRAHSTCVADPNSPPSGRAVGGGTAPDLRHPSQWWKTPPPGTPFRPPHSEQRRPARAHAVGTVLGSHARTDRTRDTRVAEPWLPAPEDDQPGEGQRLTPDAPHNGGGPPPPGDGPPALPRHAAPTGHAGQGDSVGPPHPHTRAHSMWVADPNSPPSGRAVGGRTAPDLRRPSQWWKAPPPGTPFRHPQSEQRRPAGAHAVGPVLGPHACTDRTRNTRVAEPWLPAPEDGRPGEGQRLTPNAPHNGGSPPPPGTPFRHPHSEQRRPARAHAVGQLLGPHARTDRTRDTRVAESWLPAPEDGRPGEGQRLTPDAPHNGGRQAPPGTAPPPLPRHAAPTGHASQGDSAGPPQPHTRAHSTWVADPNSPPSGRAVGGGTAPDLRRPSQWWKAPPRGRPSATANASNAGPQGCRLWGRCWAPRPHRPHPGHTGRGTSAARPRGRKDGGGTAPDTRRPSQWWQATPPGDGPPPAPRHAAPTGHASQGDSVGPPHPHTCAHSTWVADPNSPPSGRAVGGGGAPDLRRPSQRWKAHTPGDTLLPPPH